jgi:hypothetical protein
MCQTRVRSMSCHSDRVALVSLSGLSPKESLVPGVSDRYIPYWMSGRISNPMEIHSTLDVY